MRPEGDVGGQPPRLRFVTLFVDLGEVELGTVELRDGAGGDGGFSGRAEGVERRRFDAGGPDRDRRALEVRRFHQRVADAPHAHVRVTDILHEAAAAAVGLDAKTVGRAVER